ncbi:shikimate dehydrogenase [Robiginitalea sp. M366]|uniref:shikimate dehydrogenase family protein n=1 Tax=Robiginitalea aestuariiviva TaxID=3036903 RepID=UPI00240D2CBF|nr:shikimate dehydrogenase [Robiginitalea aestuariiviva]MDG1573218.1 shikimate dehydrogenase [Robiginitalea aestuariiviva]
MRRFGLVGRNIGYSFSRGYFARKFEAMGLTDCQYENFDLQDLSGFAALLANTPDLCGLNVTIPYKQEVIPFLDALDPVAEAIGAVNTIRFKDGQAIGHNTDAAGFRESLKPLLRPEDRKALVLGTGGASRAVSYVLAELGLEATLVSRNPETGQLGYAELDARALESFQVLVNCTPLGTHPATDRCPPLPYDALGPSHLLYDLIYNPPLTTFLRHGQQAGCRFKNGLEMLEIQAERAWDLWNT